MEERVNNNLLGRFDIYDINLLNIVVLYVDFYIYPLMCIVDPNVSGSTCSLLFSRLMKNRLLGGGFFVFLFLVHLIFHYIKLIL